MRIVLVTLSALLALLVGGYFFLAEPDIPRAVLEAKYATPPSAFLTLPDGTRAHIRDEGPRSASVLVLIHGSNASLFTWGPWVARLDHAFRIVTMDMPGHGLTGSVPSNGYSEEAMVRFVMEVADKLAIDRFAVGGNSMGGAVAARFAETHPDRVTALILVDAGGEPFKEGDKTPLAFRIARTPILNQILLRITPRTFFVDGLNDAIVHKAIISDAMIDQYWDFARMTGTRAASLSRLNLPRDNFVKAHIEDIRCPTLILWGEEDHLVPVSAARQFAKDIPGSKLIVYPATGHIPQEEIPEQSAADVKAFLLTAANP